MEYIFVDGKDMTQASRCAGSTRRARLITSSLGPRNCAMPELLKALNQPHPPVGQPYHPLWYEHSPALIRNKSHFQGFCTITSAPSLTGASKLFPAVLFLCKAQRNPRKIWGSSYFISSHSFNERGKFPDHLLHFEVHHFTLPSKSPSPSLELRSFPATQYIITACWRGLWITATTTVTDTYTSAEHKLLTQLHTSLL